MNQDRTPAATTATHAPHAKLPPREPFSFRRFGQSFAGRSHAYIAAQLARVTLLVLLSLTSIVWLTQALRLLDFIVNQGVSVSMFLMLTLLLLPSLIMLVLPISILVAVIFLYQRLKADSELIALMASGQGKWRLSAPSLTVAAIVAAAGYAISFYVLPVSYAKFKSTQSYLRNNYVSVLLQEGVFSSPVEGLTVFIRERSADGSLKGVLVHDRRQKDASVTMMAEEANLAETPQGPRFLLKNGNRQELRDGKLSYLDFDAYALDIRLYTQGMDNRKIDPQEMSVFKLLDSEGATDARHAQRLKAEGHQRLIWPMFALTLTLVALSLMLSGEFNRRMRWQRGALAVAAATIILFLAVGLRNLMAGNATFVPLAYANLVLPAIAAVLSLNDTPVVRWKKRAYKG